jgi:cytoskeletal protein CcmA (bactofilin family)
MKRLKTQLVILIVALAGLSAGYGLSRAAGQVAGDNVVVDQVRDEDLLIAGRELQVQSEVKGDVIAAGSDVTIAGTVAGYVMVAGARVDINGPVGNDLWAAGSSVNLNASVADNAMLAGNDVKLLPGAVVEHNAKIAGGVVSVQGRVGRNLKLAAGEAQIASEIGGSVNARAESLKLLPGAVVRGDLVVYGPKEPEISPQAQVMGRVEYHKQVWQKTGIVEWLKRWIWISLAMLIVGFVAIAASPLWADRVSAMITGKPWSSILAGLAGLLLAPLAMILLLITVVGIPLAFILLALYVIALLLSGVFVAYLVGGWLLDRFYRPQSSPYLRMALGALAVGVCVSLPWIGWLVQLFILLIGFGALMLDQRNFALRLRAQGLA